MQLQEGFPLNIKLYFIRAKEIEGKMPFVHIMLFLCKRFDDVGKFFVHEGFLSATVGQVNSFAGSTELEEVTVIDERGV